MNGGDDTTEGRGETAEEHVRMRVQPSPALFSRYQRRYGSWSGLTTADIKLPVSSGPRRTVQGGEELEAVLQVRHHAIYRWCPDAGSSAQVACIFFHCFPHLGIVDPLLSLFVLISAVSPVGAFGAYVASSVALVIVGRSIY